MDISQIKRIGILGVGFMGGSLALALKETSPTIHICGYARSKKSYNKLRKLKILDSVTSNLKEFARDLDIVVLALPVGEIINFFKKISPFLNQKTIICDLGSSKKLIEEAAKRYLPEKASFVGCHPLCGGEKSGAEFSCSDIYRGSFCIITSSRRKNDVQLIKRIWERIGSRVLFFDPNSHDRILSMISHLPHVISFSLTEYIPHCYLKLSAGSLRDLTRISDSSALVWADIFLSNKINILSDLEKFIKSLKRFALSLKQHKKDEIIKFITTANKKQRKIR